MYLVFLRRITRKYNNVDIPEGCFLHYTTLVSVKPNLSGKEHHFSINGNLVGKIRLSAIPSFIENQACRV